MKPQGFVSRSLTIDGTPTGADAITGTYTPGAPGLFFYTVPANSRLFLSRALIYIRDGGGMNWGQYGAVAALANGTIIRAKDPSGAIVLQSAPFKSNGDWARVSYDVAILNDGAGEAVFSCAWSLASAGSPIEFQPGSRIEVVAQDTLTGLSDHRISINGELR